MRAAIAIVFVALTAACTTTDGGDADRQTFEFNSSQYPQFNPIQASITYGALGAGGTGFQGTSISASGINSDTAENKTIASAIMREVVNSRRICGPGLTADQASRAWADPAFNDDSQTWNTLLICRP